MPNPNQIQRQIDVGRGHAANALGGPFNVYRLQAGSAATNFVDPANQVATNYYVYHLQRSASGFRGSYEGTALVPLFDIIGNMSPFLLGDVFIDSDAAYNPNGSGGYGAGATSVTFPTLEVYGWCLGFHGPIKKSIGARLDRYAQIYRLLSGPDASGYFSGEKAASLPVKLVNGSLVVGAVTDTAALIPIGLAAKARWRADLIKEIPTTTGEVEYLAYVPPLPGFTFKEGDRLVLQDGSEYVVQLPWEQEVGFVGSQLSVKRQVMQT